MKQSDTHILPKYETYAKEIFSWYKQSGRHDLPWRKSINAYKILVSELMLQQTQVSRVLPKFALWMKTYPTLAALSKASLQEVLLLWQGLGYQRRAKALYNIAKTAKTVPRNIEGLRELPSIGEYTAGAILAFAYDQKSVLLETNIRTALIEAFHKKKESVSDEILKKDLEKLLNTKVVKRIGYRTWYYALMDYGAYLKTQGTSHNVKAAGYRKQTPFKGSSRELRAKILFAITEKKSLPHDARAQTVINALLKEGFIKKSGISWKIA